MVERQYEALRRERLRTMEEQSKPPSKPDEVEPPNTAQPAAASAPPSDGQNPEVSPFYHILLIREILM